MRVVLVGQMAQPQLMKVLQLAGQPVQVNGALHGGARAGIDRDGWPVFKTSDEVLEGVAVTVGPELLRYAKVLGLRVIHIAGQPLMGITGQGEASSPWQATPDRDALAAEIALQILLSPAETDADLLIARLPMIGVWASSRVRGTRMPLSGQGVVQARPAGAVQVIQQQKRFQGYFAVEEITLTHDLHQGGRTAAMTREGFLMGDAVVLLPWDPVRDRVMVIEQFRPVPYLRGDRQPWLLEPIAGRVDAGEAVETAILREAQEEAALTISSLHPCFSYYPSPGAACEFLYQFIGIADLPDDVTGVHGLDSEAEDIRSHLLDRAHLSALVDQGQISNGPLATLSLWLDARVDRLRAELGAGLPPRGPHV
jgi:nudix-type nucleoside diphosphatase (YffH/AdpP family)